MAGGLVWLNVGNPLIRGLPRDSEPRQAYEQLSAAFAPGRRRADHARGHRAGHRAAARASSPRFQQVLGDQPGVAGVIGPATKPAEQPFGVVARRRAATRSAS